jgi:hypothetical protein
MTDVRENKLRQPNETAKCDCVRSAADLELSGRRKTAVHGNAP